MERRDDRRYNQRKTPLFYRRLSRFEYGRGKTQVIISLKERRSVKSVFYVRTHSDLVSLTCSPDFLGEWKPDSVRRVDREPLRVVWYSCTSLLPKGFPVTSRNGLRPLTPEPSTFDIRIFYKRWFPLRLT